MSQAGKRGPSPAKAGGAHGRSQGAASFFNLFSFNTPHSPASSTFRIAYSVVSWLQPERVSSVRPAVRSVFSNEDYRQEKMNKSQSALTAACRSERFEFSFSRLRRPCCRSGRPRWGVFPAEALRRPPNARLRPKAERRFAVAYSSSGVSGKSGLWQLGQR